MIKLVDLKFHHLGLASKSLSNSLNSLKKIGYKIEKIKINKNYNVRNAICKKKNFPTIEVVSQYKKKSPIDNIIKKNNGDLIYHICFISKDLAKTLKIFKKKKIKFIKISHGYFSPFENMLSTFFYIDGFGVIEIMDKKNEK